MEIPDDFPKAGLVPARSIHAPRQTQPPHMLELEELGFIKIKDFIGPNKSLPISPSSFYAGVKTGKYPAPVKIGVRSSALRNADARALLIKLSEEAKNSAK